MSIPVVKKYGSFTAAGTPAAVNLDLGFVPDKFEMYNEAAAAGDVISAKWLATMGSGKCHVEYVRDIAGTTALTESFLSSNGIATYSLGPTPNLDRWTPSTAFVVGDVVVPTKKPANWSKESLPVFKCTTAGTSGSSEPTWDTDIGDTTSDSGATWTCIDSGTLSAAEQKVISKRGVTIPAGLQKANTICHWTAEGKEPQ